jgi:hypothetical protein
VVSKPLPLRLVAAAALTALHRLLLQSGVDARQRRAWVRKTVALLARGSAKAGRKVTAEALARDLVLFGGIEMARRQDATVNVRAVIRDLRRHNGWPQSEATMYRRYLLLRRSGSRERRNIVAALVDMRPMLEKRLAAMGAKKIVRDN